MSELAVIAADQSALDRLDRQSVVALLERGKSWLQLAVERDAEVGEFVELKAQAETIRTYTLQKQLGKDAELAAAELVRRAERGIGVAVRRGQEAGEIRAVDDMHQPGVDTRHRGSDATPVASALQFFAHPSERTDAYAMTDGVTDGQFDDAITEAKAEGNLSRANVVRKVKGQPAPTSRRPEILRGTRHLDSNRIVDQTVIALEGLCIGLDLAVISELDPERMGHWLTSMQTSLRSITRFTKEMTRG